MVSLRDIAMICGVSVPTVSKALHGRKDVGDETRARILKTASELGYGSDASMPDLRENRSDHLGVLFLSEESSGTSVPSHGRLSEYYTSFLYSFRKTSESKGYCVTFLNADPDRLRRLSFTAQVHRYHLDGICVLCRERSPLGLTPELEHLLECGIPFLSVDQVFQNHISVCSDPALDMQDLVQYAYKCGHRRIACICSPVRTTGGDSPGDSSGDSSDKKLPGFRKAAAELGLHVPSEYLCESPLSDDNASFQIIRHFMTLPLPPTCILFADDYEAVRAAGAVPSNVSIAGFGGIHAFQQLRPRLTSIRPDTRTMGKKAADLLIGLIEHPQAAPIEHICVPGILLRGETVKTI